MTPLLPEVVVIGDALLDVTARPAGPIVSGADVPAEVRVGCGGQGANLAVRLARRGVRVGLVCALGDDAAGGLVRAALDREGVVVSPLPAEPTGTVVLLLDRRGERSMLSHRAPFAAGAAAAVRDHVGWLVVSGYLFLEPGAGRLARTLGAWPGRRVLLGCTVQEHMAGEWMAAAVAMRPDIVVLNRDEAIALLPEFSAAGDLALPLAERLGGVVVTGASGATARLNGLGASVRRAADGPASDTTGAGDAFAAALVSSLLRSPWPPGADGLETALQSATELAARVARAPGAQGWVSGEPDVSVQR